MATGSTISGSAATNSTRKPALVCMEASDCCGDLGGGNSSASLSAAQAVTTKRMLQRIPKKLRTTDEDFITLSDGRQVQGIRLSGQGNLSRSSFTGSVQSFG